MGSEMCIRDSKKGCVGGNTELLHLDDWGDREEFLNSKFAERDMILVRGYLTRHEALKRWHEEDLTVAMSSPFYQRDGEYYSRVVSEHMHAIDDEGDVWFKTLIDSLAECKATRNLPLEPGSILILNNTFWFHGRSPIQRNPNLFRRYLRIKGYWKDSSEIF